MTRTGMRVAATLLVGLLTTSLLAGCGDDEGPEPNGVAEMDPGEALTAAQKATSELDDATYTGTSSLGTINGAKKATTTIVIRSDDRCEARTEGKQTGTVTIRAIGRTLYINADAKAMRVYLEYDAARVAQLKGKWLRLEVPEGRSVGCALEDLLPGSGRHGTYADAGEGEVDGSPVRRFKGEDERGRPMTISIATEGAPLVLGVSGKDSAGKYSYELSDSNTGVEVEAPPQKKVVAAS